MKNNIGEIVDFAIRAAKNRGGRPANKIDLLFALSHHAHSNDLKDHPLVRAGLSQKELEPFIKKGPPSSEGELSPSACLVGTSANNLAVEMGHGFLDGSHLLVALLTEYTSDDDSITEVLDSLNICFKTLAEEADKYMKRSSLDVLLPTLKVLDVHQVAASARLVDLLAQDLGLSSKDLDTWLNTLEKDQVARDNLVGMFSRIFNLLKALSGKPC